MEKRHPSELFLSHIFLINVPFYQTVNPFYERHMVVENIVKEFHRQQSRNNIFTAPQPVPAIELDPNNPEHKQLLDWLNQ